MRFAVQDVPRGSPISLVLKRRRSPWLSRQSSTQAIRTKQPTHSFHQWSDLIISYFLLFDTFPIVSPIPIQHTQEHCDDSQRMTTSFPISPKLENKGEKWWIRHLIQSELWKLIQLPYGCGCRWQPVYKCTKILEAYEPFSDLWKASKTPKTLRLSNSAIMSIWHAVNT